MIHSKNFSMNKGKAPKHHHGHPHGHPTKTGGSITGTSSPLHGKDTGSMAEHGLSEGNTKGVARNAGDGAEDYGGAINKTHELQHVDYSELTGM